MLETLSPEMIRALIGAGVALIALAVGIAGLLLSLPTEEEEWEEFRALREEMEEPRWEEREWKD